MEEKVSELVNLEFKSQSLIVQFQETVNITQKEIYDTNNEIKDQLLKLQSKINELVQFGEEQDDEQLKEIVLKEAQRHNNEINRLQSLLKTANLKAKVNRQKAYEEERKNLINTGPTGLRKRTTHNWNDDFEEDSKKVNSAMININDELLTLTNQGNAINQTLELSSQEFANIVNENEDIDGKLKIAEKHMSSYKMIELTSNFMIGLAIIFYLSVCIYILIARCPVPFGALYGLLTRYWE